MDIIVQDESKKGFPIHNETVRSTAEHWAKGYGRAGKYHTIHNVENCFEKAEVFDIDSRDCTGGNAWKIKIGIATSPSHYEEVIFDLREEKLLEICQHEGVKNGIIQCPLVVAARGQFVMEKGKFHKEYLASLEAKTMKKIPLKQLEVGGCYTTGSATAREMIYLGKGKQRKNYYENEMVDGHFFAQIYGENNSDGIHLDYLTTVKSPGMKIKTRQLDGPGLIEKTINYNAVEVNKAHAKKSKWEVDYHGKKLKFWNNVKEQLSATAKC